LLSRVYSARESSSLEFIKKRLQRIYPLLFYTSVISFFGQIYVGRLVLDKVTYHSFIDTLLLCNSSPIFGIYNFGHVISWSVSAEMYAYLI
jgi:peptidoglycan/LPS O-acetylase OafA/YrhL